MKTPWDLIKCTEHFLKWYTFHTGRNDYISPPVLSWIIYHLFNHVALIIWKYDVFLIDKHIYLITVKKQFSHTILIRDFQIILNEMSLYSNQMFNTSLVTSYGPMFFIQSEPRIESTPIFWKGLPDTSVEHLIGKLNLMNLKKRWINRRQRLYTLLIYLPH